MGDFLIQEVNIRLSLREDIQWLQDELLFMQSFLKDAEEKKSGDQRVRQWVSEINSIANDIVSILETYGFESVKGDDDGFASHLKACTCICRKETKFYKFGKEIQSLMQRIMDISRKRETYGIRDINKAREGPSYNNETLEMLERMTERDLESHLRHLLEEKKYLMVVDDVWHRESWESLKRAFPNSKNGSRVIITTHKEDVAKRADNKGFVHRLRFLSQEESWDLFCRKLLAVRAMVSAMERLAKDMVDKCGGLPLAIVVLSGLLLHKRGLEEWQMVKDHLWQNIKDDSIEISYILSSSYNDLSTVLKKYFLYFGVFQKIKWSVLEI
ncbi:putative disease resistance RPP13-like protein 3 [Capsicum galapagoense]